MVKKVVYFLMLCLLLTGCGSREVFETVADDLIQSAAAPLREIHLEIPADAAAPVSEAENGEFYLCDGWEISVQTFASGDLDATLRTLTGYSREKLTVVETSLSGITRYDLVWSCVGEAGSRVGRATVLDDGNYHYVLSVLGNAERTQAWEETWETLFSSYWLV